MPFLLQWHQSTSSASGLRYSTGGVVGSGIMVFNLHICSRSSIKLFENSSVRGTKAIESKDSVAFFYRYSLIVSPKDPIPITFGIEDIHWRAHIQPICCVLKCNPIEISIVCRIYYV